VCRNDDNLYSPYVNWNDDERNLIFNWIDNDWNDNYRFLAVRKPIHATPSRLAGRGF